MEADLQGEDRQNKIVMASRKINTHCQQPRTVSLMGRMRSQIRVTDTKMWTQHKVELEKQVIPILDTWRMMDPVTNSY
jgi:hypothetical protein